MQKKNHESLINQIEAFKKEKEQLEQKINDLTQNLSRKDFEEQIIKNYDIIFRCDSFMKPFEIQTTKKYREDLKARQYPIVSVIGNFDKGKSFVLSEISGKNFPRGFNAVTPWICGFYPRTDKEDDDEVKEFNNLKFLNALLLDTAGFSTPLQYNFNVKLL